MGEDTLEQLADGWLTYHRAAQTFEVNSVKSEVPEELFHFFLDVDELVRGNPERAWIVIQLIFVKCRNDFERACLAAGPLEDLLTKYGALVIDRVEWAAANDSNFKELLVGVWRNSIEQTVWERIQRAAGPA
jgi:hypothetical protein